jgi:hypothetical protein
MGDDNPNQKAATDRSKLERTPDKSVDPLKIAGELAQKELEFAQQAETRLAGTEHKKDKAAVQADLAAKRADILASTSAAEVSLNFNPGEVPTPAPETPATQTSSSPPAKPASQTSEASKPTAPEVPAATPPDTKKNLGEALKGFFYTIFPKELVDFFAQIFTKKKTEQTSDEAASVTSDSSDVAADKPSQKPGGHRHESTSPKNVNIKISNAPSDPEVLKGPDTTAGLKGQALYNNPQFQARTDQIAQKIGVSRFDLYSIFHIESGGDPQAINPISKATGLIQFCPPTPSEMGTSVEAIFKMTGLQQLDLVERYFARNFGKLHNYADLYRAVFFPASIGQGPDYVFQTKYISAKKVATQNPGIAAKSARPDGYIDNAAFDRYCNRNRPFGSDLPMVA